MEGTEGREERKVNQRRNIRKVERRMLENHDGESGRREEYKKKGRKRKKTSKQARKAGGSTGGGGRGEEGGARIDKILAGSLPQRVFRITKKGVEVETDGERDNGGRWEVWPREGKDAGNGRGGKK